MPWHDHSLADRTASLVFGEGADRVCRDIPDAACHEQPRNLTVHLAASTATKTGDGLLDPKLVLSWLVTAIGGSASAIGLLVPVREAFSLLPQLFLGHRVRRRPRRRGIWSLAAFVQGVSVLGIGTTALMFDGAAAAWTIVGLLVLFASARSGASVSYKDVLGKTVSKSRRGTVTGTATSISAILVLAFGAALATGLVPMTRTAVGVTILVAGVLWIGAALTFLLVTEEPGATDGGIDGIATALGSLRQLGRDPQLVRFIVTRSLLTVTAIAPPYLLALSTVEGRRLDTLGTFVIASSLATIVGGRVWGKLSDRSSRQVLFGSAVAATVLFSITSSGWWLAADLVTDDKAAAVLLLLVVIAYQGVRLGRSTHLVDMADEDLRSVYTAVSNTLVGLVILATGVFGPFADHFGPGWLFVVFAIFSAVAARAAYGLDEVQR